MKILKKINRGLILTVIVVIGVAVYLACLSSAQAADREEIISICEDYIKAETGYSMLPEKYRKENPEIPEQELDAYINEAKTELKKFYVDNENTYKYLLERIESSLKSQAAGDDVILTYTKDIYKVDSVAFDGDKASVELICNTVCKTSGGSVSTDDLTNDSLMLQKIDGRWLLCYSNLYTTEY